MVNLNLVNIHSRLGVSGVAKKLRKFSTKEMNRLFSFVLRFKLFVWHWADEKHNFTMQRRTGLWWRVIWSFSNYNCVVFEHKVMAKERKCSHIVHSHMSKLCLVFCLKTNTSEAYKSVQNRSTFLKITLGKTLCFVFAYKECRFLSRVEGRGYYVEGRE